MPMFDLLCPSCNTYSEDVLIPVDAERLCPVCGAQAISKGVIVNTHGIVYSNTEQNTQLGVTFTSNAERRAGLKQLAEQTGGEVREYIKGSSDEQKLADRIREKAETSARKHGYRDLEDRNSRVRSEYNKGWRPRG